MIYLLYSSIECYNFEVMVCNIHYQVLSHDRKANETKISTTLKPQYVSEELSYTERGMRLTG